MCAPISNSRSKLGGIIQATDPEQARRRDEELLVQSDNAQAAGAAPRPRAAWRCAAACRHACRTAAGLGDGQRIDDHVGYRFAVLAAPGLAPALTHHVAARRNMDAVLLQADGEAADYLARLGAKCRRHSPGPAHSWRRDNARRTRSRSSIAFRR